MTVSQERIRNSFSFRVMRRYAALPSEHGAWVFLFSPLLIGLFAGGRFTAASALLVVALLAAFLIRQPLTLAVKAYSGRRPRSDLAPARFWMVVYGLPAALAVAGLVWMGAGYILWLALPAVPVLGWHLWLVSRRSERRAVWMEIAASGVLALAAPAALWIGKGQYEPAGWLLWGLAWLQSASSIVYIYLRLEQRKMNDIPQPAVRLQMGRGALAATTFALVMAAGLSIAGVTPKLLPAAFAIQWLESIWGVFRPAAGAKPVSIGMRQLAVSSLFTVVFILAWG